MGIDPVTATIGAALLGAVVSKVQGDKQAKAMEQATQQSQTQADKLYAQQDQATNKANAKQPNTAAMQSQNQVEGQQGQSGTMLTGPLGVDPNDLSLGKNTLLGGAVAGG